LTVQVLSRLPLCPSSKSSTARAHLSLTLCQPLPMTPPDSLVRLVPSFTSIMALPNLAVNVPQIKLLREELDYGERELPRCPAFYDDMRVFRKKFETKGGVPGYRLYKWKSHDHRSGLTEMTHEYLEVHGSGPKFWPDDKTSHFYNTLQYSTHHEYIKRKVLQLLWRQNLQQLHTDNAKERRNSPRRHKVKRHGENASGNDAPIDPTSSNANASITLSNSHRPPARQSNVTEPCIRAIFRTVANEPTGPAAPLPRMQFEPTVDGQTSDANARRGQYEDRPRLSNIPEPAVAGGTAIFRVFPLSSSPDGNQSADETDNERPAKLAKLRQDHPGAERTEYARKKVGPLRSYRRVKSTLVRQRWSGRSRTERQLFGAASQEQLEQLDEELEFPSEESEESGSSAKRKLLVKLNTRPCVMSDLAGEEAVENADGAAPRTLGEWRETAPSTQIGEAHVTQPQRGLMPADKEQIRVTTVFVRPQPEAPAPAPAQEVPVQEHPVSGAPMASLPLTEPAAASGCTVEHEAKAAWQQHEDDMTNSTTREESPPSPPRDPPTLPPRHHTQTPSRQLPTPSRDSQSPSNQEPEKKKMQTPEQEGPPRQDASAQKPTPEKPNIRVRYSVILSRNPVLQCRYWKPNGAFRDKTWSQLKEEIPLKLGADTRGLLFRLTGPGLSTDEVVLHGEDEEFEVVKTCFERMIRACVPKGVAGGKPPIFMMEMEALTDESPAAAAGEVYEEAFAW
ncbi:Uncharacterized protein TCAP_01213, partial [Tolypocladium capitatum]